MIGSLVCPTHGYTLRSVPMVKGSRFVGRNHFCTVDECYFEVDTGVRR